MSHVGSYARNLREGKRSEYLALYFFSSLGTAVPVPTAEDAGLDLHCTIADVRGLRAWPRCFYSVQVKSEMKAWSIESTESVRWLATQPFPIFLCIVEKMAGRFRVYQTLPRHLLHAHPPLPGKVDLVPEEGSNGRITQWTPGQTSLSLSAPVLDFTIDTFLDDAFIVTAKSIISAWASWDSRNTHMRESGMLHAAMPSEYVSNQELRASGSMRMGRMPGEEALSAAVENLSRSLLWTASGLSHAGAQGLAVRIALLLRRLEVDCTMELVLLLRELCSHLGKPAPEHLDSYSAGLDAIDAAIESMLPEEWKGLPLIPASRMRRDLWIPPT
jgi:hypothetical protein